MKTLDEIKDEIAKEYGHSCWVAVKNKFKQDSFDVSPLITFCDEANKQFYSQSADRIDGWDQLDHWFDKPTKQWINIKDRLPKTSGKYLTFSHDYHLVGHGWYNNKYNIGWEDDKENSLPVSHWMNLPQKPKP